MKKSVLTVLSVLLPILASAQAKPDTLFFVNGEKAIASISKMSSEEVEYTYPNEVLVNSAKTSELVEVHLGSGRVVQFKKYNAQVMRVLSLDSIPKEKSPWSELSFLANDPLLNLFLDFSEAEILHQEARDFIANEPNWASGIAEVEAKFISNFNKRADKGKTPHRVGHYADAPYTLLLKVTTVEDKGSEINGYLCILDIEGNIVFCRKFEAEDGVAGSVLNLMGDAMTGYGEDLGDSFRLHARDRNSSTATTE